MKLIHDPPPQSLIKYCKHSDFEKFARSGLFRLRSHKYYRDEFELYGAGYGDANEGLEHTQLPRHRVTIEAPGFIFCLSKSWSSVDQIRWYRRPKCNYDFAFEVHGPEFLKAMRYAVYKKYDQRAVMFLGSVDYDHTTKQSQDVVSFTLSKSGFRKDHPFTWEDEYRLIVRDRSDPSYGSFLQLKIENVSELLAGAYIVRESGVCEKFTL